MKLSKNYLLKKSETYEIIPFTFPIIYIYNQKTTRRLPDSPSGRLPDSGSGRLPNSASRQLPDSASGRLPDSVRRGGAERKKIASKSSFRTRRPKIRTKKTIFCPKMFNEFIESLSLKKFRPIISMKR